ncbi:MAG: hypothetical protein A2046_01840 [Bacteroidetes bacterium GWA2_30_7]|nr:MAG: hypothetical protein A2046_01840 [Bacteroidetes bacterium GWA2_30_7]
MKKNNQDNNIQLLVNMPNCTNLQFTFVNGFIIKSKRISDINAKNATLYYKLSEDLQDTIFKFLNPKAIIPFKENGI